MGRGLADPAFLWRYFVTSRTCLSPLSFFLLAAGAMAQTAPLAVSPFQGASPAGGTSAAAAIQPGGGTVTAGGNLILNGDFETYTGGGCDTNMANGTFTAQMANATGFGEASELDVDTNPPCYGLPAISGSRKTGLHTQTAGGPADAFSLDLATPLVAGQSYSLSFSAHAVIEFDPDFGSVEVGISENPADFGTLVFTGTLTSAMSWHNFSTTFTAPIAGAYLTVREGPEEAWSHVDAFVLSEAGPGTKYCTANTNSTGLPADLSSSGSSSSSAGDLTLTSQPVPNQNSIFFHGENQSQTPFGNGFMCTTGNIVRGAVVPAVGNVATYTYDNSDNEHSLAAFVGTTRHFQHWFRDPMGGGAFFNLSNGLSIAITP